MADNVAENMADNETLKKMVMSFRVSELHILLGFAGRNKSGRKTELQTRAVQLLGLHSTAFEMKIKELYRTNYPAHATEITMQQPTLPRDIADVHLHSPNIPEPLIQQRGIVDISGYQNDISLLPRGSGVYPPNSYIHQPRLSPTVPYSFPVHPDVKLKKLPFFDVLGELLKPSTLVPLGTEAAQEGNFMFHLTPQQATDIYMSRQHRGGCKLEYVIQVQMRFSLIETSCEQEDCFPPGIFVKVNGKNCQLPNTNLAHKPGSKPKRSPQPLNITSLVCFSPTVANRVNVLWNLQYGKTYCVTITLVRKLSSCELFQRLKQRGPRHPDYTRGLIKEKLKEDAECEIATTTLRVSLLCPLGKMRMTTPCRSVTCLHLQCFDAAFYLQMNEKKPTWMCPVCDNPATYDNLVIDGYFQGVLSSLSMGESNEIQLHQDGSWSAILNIKESVHLVEPWVKLDPDDIIILEPTEEHEPPRQSSHSKKEPIVIDLTVSDSDDDLIVTC